MIKFYNIKEIKDSLNLVNMDHWLNDLLILIDNRLSKKNHGHFDKWKQVIKSLSEDNTSDENKNLLMQLSPWRKGPFEIDNITIDSEWRSDKKWSRIKKANIAFTGKNILDVGCGNGYFALNMRLAGAKSVIGIDPSILYVMQFIAINIFKKSSRVSIFPLRLCELPLPINQFDITFSMGVLYHQRSPIEHLYQLKKTLKPGGKVVLETLYLPGLDSFAATPQSRYARMRNIWLLPTISELKIWLARTGFDKIETIDKSITTIDEQRSTKWMTFDSLDQGLDPTNTCLTIEGWPAPRRILMTAEAI
tara:strand:- start:6114 stop:7031 length:918 start_codon:yes stop_codon:yes gene_type:complete